VKRIAAALLLTASALFAELTWVEDYEKGLARAKEEGKAVMVMLSKEHCPACRYMKEIVFDDDEIAEAVEAHFVPVLLDVNTHLLHGLSFIGTPTFYFLQQNGRRIERYDGGANQKEFMDLLRRVEQKLARP
jgi:thioredoxin-related protein